MAKPKTPKTEVEPQPPTVQAALDAIRKKHGTESIALVGALYSAHDGQPVEVISTGSLRLDCALGCGGWARGRISELYGQESSGKTTLALQAIAQAQAAGLACAFVDAEHALDTKYATNLGVSLASLALVQPNSGEEGLQIVEELCDSRAFGIVVVDSVAALVPQAELDADTGSSLPGLHARLMSQHLRKVAGKAARTSTHVMYLNQMRMKIGVMYGNPNTTTGGNALKFYASQRVATKRTSEKLMEGAAVVGATHEAEVVKNKLVPPFQSAKMDILWGRGVDKFADLRDVALEKGVLVHIGGGNFHLDGQPVCRGLQKLRETLELSDALRASVAEGLAKVGVMWRG